MTYSRPAAIVAAAVTAGRIAAVRSPQTICAVANASRAGARHFAAAAQIPAFCKFALLHTINDGLTQVPPLPRS